MVGKGNQLAAWTRGAGWVYSEIGALDEEEEEESEIIMEGTSGLTISGGLVTGYSGNSTSVVIPSYYNGQSVTGIASYGLAFTSITSVTVGGGITSVGDFAFMNCSNLASISLPSSVNSIGTRA